MKLKTIVLSLLFVGILSNPTPAKQPDWNRFFYHGDGYVHLVSRKNGKVFKGHYRQGNHAYEADAYKQISAVFDAPYQPPRHVLSLRLLEFLDYLGDQLGKGAQITVTSGYRPPDYNTKLRKKGILAAKASLHQYGMAVDFIMDGVSSKRVWEYVRSIGFGGTGYYHGSSVHVDVGPARFWDERSSGVGMGLSNENKLIGLIADYDVYAPGDSVTLSFIRMTAFPITVSSIFHLAQKKDAERMDEVLSFNPTFETATTDGCGEFNNIGEMDRFQWRLPSKLTPGRYMIRAAFCGNLWEQMPKEVYTPEFEVR
ncbi:MAG: DUF882 domain-containing protein [Desulfosarcina sp.]|jgi:uncharacterized protein YcbK (DUF882 family)